MHCFKFIHFRIHAFNETVAVQGRLTENSDHTAIASVAPDIPSPTNDDDNNFKETRNHENFKWGDVDGKDFINRVDEVYEKIVFWRKNLFLLPSGKAGKEFISEMTRLLNSWIIVIRNNSLMTMAG